MSLTQSDLEAIKHLFDDKFDSIDNRFNSIDIRLQAIDVRLQVISDNANRVEEELGERIDELDNKITKIERNTKYFSKLYMKDIPNHEGRIDQIEKHLKLPQDP